MKKLLLLLLFIPLVSFGQDWNSRITYNQMGSIDEEEEPKSIRENLIKFKTWIDENPFRKQKYFKVKENWVIGNDNVSSNNYKFSINMIYNNEYVSGKKYKVNRQSLYFENFFDIDIKGIDYDFIIEEIKKNDKIYKDWTELPGNTYVTWNMYFELGLIIDDNPQILINASYSKYVKKEGIVLDGISYKNKTGIDETNSTDRFLEMLKEGNEIYIKFLRYQSMAESDFDTDDVRYKPHGDWKLPPPTLKDIYYKFSLMGISKALQF